jgi:hypothetical protein
MTENRPFAQLLPKLFKRAFSISFDKMPEESEKPGKLVFYINDPQKLDKIFQTYGYSADSMLAHHINLGVLEDECCRKSFIRGAFLGGGSVTDPAKQYHLELVTDHYNVSRETYSLLLEMGFRPKETSRNGNYITYFKQSDVISDLLTTIGASGCAMEIISAKIEKDMRNSVNRKVNCDTANVLKIVDASRQQIESLKKLDSAIGLHNLPEKLYQTAMIRMENPELSISELAAVCLPPVTKSCLSHRLRKLMDMARECE